MSLLNISFRNKLKTKKNLEPSYFSICFYDCRQCHFAKS